MASTGDVLGQDVEFFPTGHKRLFGRFLNPGDGAVLDKPFRDDLPGVLRCREVALQMPEPLDPFNRRRWV
jgi:hypothetical protein